MMFDAINPIRTSDRAVQVFDENGNALANFAGPDLQAWRQFQIETVTNFNIVVPDAFMPLEISRTISTPNKRHDDAPSGG